MTMLPIPPRGGVEHASTPPAERLTLAQIDKSCAKACMVFIGSGVFWLICGSVLAMAASIKLHTPGFLDGAAWLTFGRVRPAHLNTMIYGWSAMSGAAVLLWIQARLSKARLAAPRMVLVTAWLWNLGVAAGTIAILAGYGTSVEWLEFPAWVALPVFALFGIVGLSSIWTFLNRRTSHVYVTQWYFFGAIIWFPFLYLVGNVMVHLGGATGSVSASANWWFAHNVLGLFLTPIGVGAAYYLIPKVIGKPIHSYYLSILGFWTLAFFYNWAGTHHLIGGPLPAWLITVGVVGSVMMFVPVIAVAINHHFTLFQKGVRPWALLARSPTLRFTVVGAVSYTLVSFQGSLQSLRTVNEVWHFTHSTVAHAHLGVYAFSTMIMYGAIYYMLPRLTGREWHSARLIKIHFWCSFIGIYTYWIGLTIGGTIQGMQMNDPDVAFLELMQNTEIWLHMRSGSGVLLSIGHAAFAWSVYRILFTGRTGGGPTLLRQRPPETSTSGDAEHSQTHGEARP